MDTEDGNTFIKNLAYFVRTHEKALANALQLKRTAPKNASGSASAAGPTSPTTNSSSSSSTFAAALSLPYLNFSSHSVKAAKLTLTPHHLFYLLSRFEELGIPVGPMNVRLENIHSDASPTNYVSFLSQAQRKKSGMSDRESIHSVNSMRSAMSGMSSLWANFGLSSNSAKTEKQKAAVKEDLKYLYSAFTKIPCLRLAPDHKARLIAGYEEFPFDTAVPLFVFKNLSALEIIDVDFRQFYGWDRLSEQLRSLTIKRGGVEEPTDLLINVVLDDADRRRRRSAKASAYPMFPPGSGSPGSKDTDTSRSAISPPSPTMFDRRSSIGSPHSIAMARQASSGSKGHRTRRRSISPNRPKSARHGSSSYAARNSTPNLRRSSGSSNSSARSTTPRGSSSNLLALGILPPTKWRFLKHLSLADNGLTAISANSLAPLASTLQSLDLSTNLFTEIPDSLATLTSLRALNLSNCMIESLHSLVRNPLPAITTLNLRANRLVSLAGVERLLSLERLDLRENKLTDPTEVARLTGIPEMQEIYVYKNPFCKTHSNYRIMVFNLFRSSPGYTEDIVIDSTGPGYSERKQLVDRVPENANPLVMKPLPVEGILTEAGAKPVQPTYKAGDDRKTSAEGPPKSKPERVVGSIKKRKGPKRRIVELSQNDSAHQRNDSAMMSPPAAPVEAPSADSTYGGSPEATPVRKILAPAAPISGNQQLPHIDTAITSTPLGAELDFSSMEAGANGDLYKKKIEALRNDFGNSWLSALSDEAYQPNSAFPDRVSPALRPSVTSSRTPSQGIASGGRTLG
ncbi:leucine rich repeat domain-containing protein [Diplodia corticola]|uniref:Leucine rich repeat domain-containing protein n=1 Tax=Diplodia corticola TaxID=236234 RepID=A0A1J9QL05_9PEZI|nr:leucine rich repeat domain-containing protein [Diplodia corticola]OJD29145.1 leucine rich repeat domain-containing protein [Diplodia corticola]